MRLILEIARYMQTHYKEKLSLKELGQVFHMSPKYFSVFFQKHFSENLTDYLTSIRIECAKKMLVESDADMELISQQAGFSSASYFIRMFRKALGLTPGQYRKKYKNNSIRNAKLFLILQSFKKGHFPDTAGFSPDTITVRHHFPIYLPDSSLIAPMQILVPAGEGSNHISCPDMSAGLLPCTPFSG